MSWLRKRMGAADQTQVGAVDPVLAATIIALVGFGIVMVYSASAIEATVRYHDPEHFLKRQFMFGIAGLGVMGAVSYIDYHRLRRLTYPVLGSVTVLMILTVIGMGVRRGGAARWLTVGPILIQPAEMAKLALVVWLAYSLAKKADKVRSFTVGFIPHVLMAGGLILLCLKQPDFGSAVVIAFLTFALLFVAGARMAYLFGGLIAVIAIGVQLVMSQGYRMARLTAYLDIAKHRQGSAYQPFQSVMSFGSGEITGLGLGKGLQVLYLPEAHNDFIAAIIGEELGFIGVLGLASVFLLIVARGVRAAFRASDDFGSYLAFGISSMLGIQALVNMAVAMAILPTKGLTLPFISYGGSSLLVNAAAAGVLLNISRPRTQRQEVEPARTVPEDAEASEILMVSAQEGAG
ncbi:MAG TPA: putative lipid II flippase FtsW [Polyangiaceae bacterium]|nr:MAG: Lipid II flippase FtsW [Deltaproteobacteria bacterium ADurb.Bin207]HNS98764.1 putative lipid II flippase FtsW [Polyangiaceae bacterium]HNZ23650.1 putative lipid II flippase FtsW [Polyangiaceae bacterium]HOD22434.1 putative lipid II flippase FtsW [Polyangiaceae bacterium]HOE47795.1 putative lipid II flippase FtsW [Polyangiaceae bacterium]